MLRGARATMRWWGKEFEPEAHKRFFLPFTPATKRVRFQVGIGVITADIR